MDIVSSGLNSPVRRFGQGQIDGLIDDINSRIRHLAMETKF